MNLFFFFASKRNSKNMYLNVVILEPWNNEAEIQIVFIRIYICTSTCRTRLIRSALDRLKSELSSEFFPGILKAFLTSLN